MTAWRAALLRASDRLGAWPWRVRAGPASGLRLVAPLRRRPGYCLGRHEPHVVACLERHLRPSAVVLDIGSHLGFFALVAAGLVTSTGRVYAFEPLPHNAVKLAHTLRRNRLDNVHLVTRALGSSTGRASFAAPANDSMAHVLAEVESGAAERGSVPLMRLDDWIEENPAVRRLDLIKLDVEGHELAVLHGAEQTLRRFAPKLVIELHWCRAVLTLPAEVVDGLEAQRYQVRLIKRRADDRELPQILAEQADTPPPVGMTNFHVIAEPVR